MRIMRAMGIWRFQPFLPFLPFLPFHAFALWRFDSSKLQILVLESRPAPDACVWRLCKT
jgi:hypothetical protein